MLEGIKKTLAEIVENNRVVIFDACIESPFIGGDILEMFYDCKELFALNDEKKRKVELSMEYIDFMMQLLEKHDNIIILPEVADEISEKQKIASYDYSFHRKQKEGKIKRGLNKGVDKCGSGEELIEEYTGLLYGLSRTASSKEKRPDYGSIFIYNALLNNIKLLNKEIGLTLQKLPDRYPYPRRKEKAGIDRGTDFKIGAMAFYKSIIDETDACIVSNDRDLKKINGISYLLLMARDLGLPENGIFRKLEKYAPKVYSRFCKNSNGGYGISGNPKELQIPDEFIIFKKSRKESDAIKEIFRNNLLEAEKTALEYGLVQAV